MKACDFSNFQRVPLIADLNALRDMGITRCVIGSSFGTVWHDQMAACEAAGFEVQNYCFSQHVTFTKPYWLDVEREPNHVTTKEEVRAICASAMPPIGIYTSSSMWAALMGSWDIVAEFPFLKLWDANYGPLPRPFTPYGGWTEPAMTQYAGTTDIGTGFEVDLSEYTEEEDMKPYMVWDTGRSTVYFIGPFGAVHVVYPADKAALIVLYGDIDKSATVGLSSAQIDAFGVVK